MKGAIWRLPEMEEYTNDVLQLTKLADVDTTPYGTDLKTIVYHPTDSKKLISVVDNNFILWDLANERPQVSNFAFIVAITIAVLQQLQLIFCFKYNFIFLEIT